MKTNLKRVFLIGVIASLSVTALIAIAIFLGGKFDKTEGQVLLTTLAIGGYSLTGLCNSVLWGKKPSHPLALLGMVVSVLALFVTVATIWEITGLENSWRPCLSLLVLAVASGHASLLLATCDSTNSGVRMALLLTITFIASVAGMFLYLIFNLNIMGTEFYRMLGIVAVLDVLGTLVTPILKKIGSTAT